MVRLIRIGKDKFKGTPVNFRLRSFGTTLILAKSRYGKTALEKHLACLISRKRKTVIFDVNGEWINDVVKFNWNSPNPVRFCNYNILDNFCFRIQDFDRYSDWISLGFPPVGSRIMSRLARHPDIHKDSPIKFTELLAQLPTHEGEEDIFNDKFTGGKFTLIEGRVMDVTKASIRSRFSFIKDYFWNGDDDPRSIIEWEQVFKSNENLIINVDCGGEHNKSKARAYIGKILERFYPYLQQKKPVLIFEEADWIAPAEVGEEAERWPSSLIRLIEYSIKYQKYGVNLMLISQSESLIHENITKHAHSMILGHVPKSDSNSGLTKKLVWNPDKQPYGYREFVQLHPSRHYDVFIPDISGCAT